MAYYDIAGFYSAEEIEGRFTEIEPTGVAPEGTQWNWTGYEWSLMQLPVPQPEPTPNPTEWLIDVGPFFDRFGANKMAVLTSTDAGVKAILEDLRVRKWIDLKRPDVAQGLAYVGSVVTTVNATQIDKILNDTVQPEENLALRKAFFI